MRIVIALDGENRLSGHFAHSDRFRIADIESGKVIRSVIKKNPYDFKDLSPGELPAYVKGLGADVLLVGGIGTRAVNIFEKDGVDIVYGLTVDGERALRDFLEGKLKKGKNECTEG